MLKKSKLNLKCTLTVLYLHIKIKVMHQIFNKFKSIFKHTDNLQVS